MPVSSVRSPRLRIIANGSCIPGALEANVSSNNHRAADCFHFALALAADPTAASFWTGTTDILVDVQMSLDGTAYTSVIQGLVDRVEVALMQGLIQVEGRDLTAGLIEARTQETFSNRTSSEIAQILADRHGLGSQITPTSTPVGRYYQVEHDRITLGQFSRATTEWDLLTYLAQQVLRL